MKATALLLELLRNGAQLWAEGGELCFRAPEGVLTPDLREKLSQRKPEIVSLLGQRARYALPSFAQQRLWVLDQSEPDNPFYNTPIAVRLTGQLNVGALEQSLRELARRHQALRTTFASVEEQPFQVIDMAPSLDWTLPVIDLRELPESERQAEARRLAEAEARRTFDLARGPVWRAQLLRLDPAEHVLLLTIHHIAFDCWSMGVLFRELATLYEAFVVEKPSPLPELPIQYADFAVWQWLQGEALEAQLSYWKRQLSGSTPVLELPTDRPRPPVQTFRGTRHSLTLPKSLTEALEELSRRGGVTLFMTLLAAFQALLHRYTGQDDIVVGSPIANRDRAEVGGLIGFFANTLALRTDLSGDPTFQELLGRVREVTLGAHAHQDLPFEKLVEELEPERYTSGAPLFQVMFVLQNTPTLELELAGLTSDRLEVDNGTAKFDLVLHTMEGPEGLRVTLEYNADLFDAATIERMQGHFRTLLEEIVADPERRLSELAEARRRPVSSRRQAWLQERGIDFEAVEAALLEEYSIEDCAVVARETESGDTMQVAYVVVLGAFSPERLREHLRTRLPEALIPSAYVPVSALPLTPTGQIDKQALCRLPVTDDLLMQRWEQHLRSLPDVDQVALVAKEKTRRLPPPLHLDDLLPKRTPAAPAAGPVASLEGSTAKKEEEDRPMALADGGRLTIPDGAPETLTEALLRTATEHADKGITCVRSDGSETFESYAALLDRARRILAGLQERGLRPGDRAILQVEALEDHYPAFWACVLGGIAPATVAVAPSYAERNGVVDKLFNSWELLGHPPILASRHLVEPIARLARLLPMDGLTILPVDELKDNSPTGRVHHSRPDDLAFLQLTSGSTGVPKCVQEVHRSIVAHANAVRQADGYAPEDVTLNWMPVDHVGALLMWHLRDTYLGCQQVHVKTDLILADPLKWLDLLEAHRVSSTWSPNFGYKLVADQLMTVTDRRWDLSRMRFFLNGGEQVTLSVAQDFLKRVAPFGVSERAMQPAYGGAETCTRITANNDFDVRTGARRFLKSSLEGRLQQTEADDSTATTFIDVGPPLPGVQLRIVDRNDELFPEGVIGRLQIKGPVVTPGYLDNEAANREAFADDGWFNLGDLGFILDGRLSLTGREKETIVVRGANFYCHEIEDVVNTVEGVEPTFAGTCAVADSATGTEGFAVFFVPKNDAAEDVVELVRMVRARVATSLGVNPTYVVPLAIEDFPKTTSGKIQRSQLKEAFEAGRFRDALKALDVVLENANTLPDWFYRRTWRRREMPSARSAGRKTLVLLDRSSLGASLAKRERRYGRPWVEVEAGPTFEKLDQNRYRIDPGRPADYRRLLATVTQDGIGIEEVVHLWSYGADEISDLRSLEAAQERGACSLLFLLQALAGGHSSDQPVRLLVVSSHAQPVLPTDRVACEQGPLLGLVRTAPKEWPRLDCHHVDLQIDDLAANADAVLRELRAVRADQEVAYRDGLRWVPRLEHVDLRREQSRPLPFERGGLYLVTGGLGGVAGEVTTYLLKQHEARVLLVGRTPLPDSEAWDTEAHSDTVAGRIAAYRALEQLGGEVLYRSADVADPAHLRAVVAEAETRWARALDGVVHLAGVFEERPLAEETRETFIASLRPKLQGTWVLHELAKDRPDCAFITFSSAHGILGAFGAGAYVAANSFLDSFAHYRRRAGLPSACFAWGLWQGIGMSRGYPHEELLKSRGFPPISPEQGLSSLLAGLHRDQVHLLVGLDATRSHIGRHVEQPADNVHALRAYCTARNGRVSAARPDRPEVRDRFGTPSACELVWVPELPQTGAGAIDRTRLAELGRHAATGRAGPEPKASFVGPRTPTEVELAGIWADVLQLQQVSIDDDFFELGGHSLLAVRVMRRLNRHFSVELPLHALSDAPTVAGLALAVMQTKAEADTFPLSPGQRQMWFGEQHRPGLFPGTPTLHLRGPLDVAALEASLREICTRHEALCTTFDTRDGKPVQIVGPPRPVPLTRVDLRELPPPAREEEAGRLLVREAQRPFDLSRGPMLRATLLRLGDEEHVLLLVAHHIVCDAWSMDEVLFRELQALYGASRAGERANLPELPVQYVDYVLWQRQRLQDGALRQSLEYWKRQLADAPKVLDIPTDRPRPPVRSSGGAWQELRMPLIRELHALCRRQNVTLFMTLLAAWATLLHRYSGQDDILIFTPFANRNRVEVEGLIGFFANNLVLRHDLSGDPSFAELLGRVRETAIDAFSHGEWPFGKLPKELLHKKLPDTFFSMPPRSSPQLDGLQVKRIEIDHAGTALSLGLFIIKGDDGLRARLNYDPDLFEAATAARMLGNFRTLLESVLTDPEQHVSKLPLPIKAGGGWQARFGKRLSHSAWRARRRLRHAALRARRTTGQLRARIKNSPFFR